ncbi:MAG: hypothetical protein WCC25_20550, partial [Candidatus Korobacteraceae bacterium]
AHTEEMLTAAGADIEVQADGSGSSVVLRPSALHPTDIDVPADPSQAAFWVVAALRTFSGATESPAPVVIHTTQAPRLPVVAAVASNTKGAIGR